MRERYESRAQWCNRYQIGASEPDHCRRNRIHVQCGLYLPARVRDGHKMGDVTVVDHMVYDGLTDAFEGYHMGITAENIAEKYAISREEQDEFAIESQQRAIAAIDNGKFKSEIVPIEYKVKKETHVFDTDDLNRTTSLEKLSTLRPGFQKRGFRHGR